jgi:hypothetical protein
MPVYRPSEATQTVTLAAPVNTVTTLEVRGSEDGYASDRREFTTEEDLRINGSVTAANGASLEGINVQIYVNGVLRGTAPLSYDSMARTNLYVFALGVLTAEGSYTLKASFPRTRTFAASQAEAMISTPVMAITLNSILGAGSLILGLLLLLRKLK